MQSFKIYIYALLHKLAVFIFACLVFSVAKEFCLGIYKELSSVDPTAFPAYHPITNKEEYLLLTQRISVFASIPAIFLVAFFAEPFANERFEYIIKRTDGMYFIRDGARIYFPRYYLADIVSALLIPSLAVVAVTFIPRLKETEAVFALFNMCDSVASVLGPVWAALLLFAIFLFSILAGALRALAVWRGRWLSSIGKVGG